MILNLIEENGKRYLLTEIIQDGRAIHTDKLFRDLKEVEELDKSNGVETDRKHPARSLLNKFSGAYMSPTMLKGFNDCQCQLLYNSLMPYVPSDITAIGTTVHSIFQDFYDQEMGKRDIDKIDEIMNKHIKLRDQEKQRKIIEMYVQGFKDTPDYIDGKPMDHNALNCFNELFMKGTAKPLGIQLPLPIYNLCDRVDFRDDGAYVIDYKTGTYLNPKIKTMDGYLPQLMSYKWFVESEYGEKVKGAIILAPGTKEKIIPVDVNSLENQSRYIEKIFIFKDEFKKSAEIRTYKQKTMQYCSSCKFNKHCNTFNGTNLQNQVIEVKYDVTLKNQVKEVEEAISESEENEDQSPK